MMRGLHEYRANFGCLTNRVPVSSSCATSFSKQSELLDIRGPRERRCHRAASLPANEDSMVRGQRRGDIAVRTAPPSERSLRSGWIDDLDTKPHRARVRELGGTSR